MDQQELNLKLIQMTKEQIEEIIKGYIRDHLKISVKLSQENISEDNIKVIVKLCLDNQEINTGIDCFIL